LSVTLPADLVEAEAIALALNGEDDSLGRQLGAVDRFIEDLRS
jgi:hypothetical protein